MERPIRTHPYRLTFQARNLIVPATIHPTLRLLWPHCPYGPPGMQQDGPRQTATQTQF